MLTRQDMADLLGVTVDHFDKRHRRLIPETLIEHDGRRVLFRFAAVGAIVEGLVEAERERLATPGADPMLTGEPSPALERYREVRAKLAERELVDREGELVNVEAAAGIIAGVVGRLRVAASTLAARFGESAGDVLLEALEDARREAATLSGGEV